MNDVVNHPNHYIKNAIVLEPIELTGRLNSCIGQALQLSLIHISEPTRPY